MTTPDPKPLDDCDTIEVVTNPAELVLPAPPEDPDEDRAYQAYSDRQVNGEAR